ncbi:hypothetical protein ACMGDH_13025 [Sphingomonas sp. DT-207]
MIDWNSVRRISFHAAIFAEGKVKAMRKLVLPLLASTVILSSPVTASTSLSMSSAAYEEDHPAPPWITYPECEEAARRFARNHSGTTYVWDPMYVYYYYTYYTGDESVFGAPGCPLVE